jgi:hypothetical protein
MLQWIFLLFLNHQWMAYAFSFEGWKKHKKLKIAGEVAAGVMKHLHLILEILFAFSQVRQFRQVRYSIMQEKVKLKMEN